MIMAAMPEYYYWKPIQSGTVDGTDSETVRRLSECSPNRILPEAYIFSEPLSPHAAAKIDGMKIENERLRLPEIRPLLIEGAGGVLVPLTEDMLYIDVFKSWKLPVLLACRSGLGTINHSLLSMEALRKRDIPILGCVLIGERNIPNEQAIAQYGAIEVIGHIPLLLSFEPNALKKVFEATLKKIQKKLHSPIVIQ